MSVLEKLRQAQQAAGLVADPETGAPAPGFEADTVGPAPKQGYLRIFPASYGSLVAVPQSFKDEFWQTASPYCRVEGLPDHPEFEKNLAAIEI